MTKVCGYGTLQPRTNESGIVQLNNTFGNQTEYCINVNYVTEMSAGPYRYCLIAFWRDAGYHKLFLFHFCWFVSFTILFNYSVIKPVTGVTKMISDDSEVQYTEEIRNIWLLNNERINGNNILTCTWTTCIVFMQIKYNLITNMSTKSLF